MSERSFFDIIPFLIVCGIIIAMLGGYIGAGYYALNDFQGLTGVALSSAFAAVIGALIDTIISFYLFAIKEEESE